MPEVEQQRHPANRFSIQYIFYGVLFYTSKYFYVTEYCVVFYCCHLLLRVCISFCVIFTRIGHMRRQKCLYFELITNNFTKSK